MYSWETDWKEAGRHTTVAAMKQTALKPHNRSTRVPHIEGIFWKFVYFPNLNRLMTKHFLKSVQNGQMLKKPVFFWGGGVGRWLVVLPDQV